jgi:hypothetical protein
MTSTDVRVLLIGLGDLGYRVAAGLADSAGVTDLVCAGGGKNNGEFLAGKLDSCYDARVRFEPLDGTRQEAVETLIQTTSPHLIVIAASLLNPWEILAARGAKNSRIREAGVAVQLPSQLPILLSVMRAVRAVDFQDPVASFPWPDGTHPILAKLDLAPTIGLGNPGMIMLRVRSALRHQFAAEGHAAEPIPLIRILGDASTLWSCLAGEAPASQAGCRVYLGEEGVRADDLAYQGHPWPTGFDLNELTAASALPVLKALLPGGGPLRFTCPGFKGQPGGYPVRIEGTRIDYDFPPGVTLKEAIAFNTRHAREEGIDNIGDDGTVTFTEHAKKIMADIAPDLTEPLAPDDAYARFPRLLEVLEVAR